MSRLPGSHPVVAVKRRGRGDPEDGYALMRLDLLSEAPTTAHSGDVTYVVGVGKGPAENVSKGRV